MFHGLVLLCVAHGEDREQTVTKDPYRAAKMQGKDTLLYDECQPGALVSAAEKKSDLMSGGK